MTTRSSDSLITITTLEMLLAVSVLFLSQFGYKDASGTRSPNVFSLWLQFEKDESRKYSKALQRSFVFFIVR